MTTNGSGFNLGDDPNNGYWMVAANPQDDVVVRHSSQPGWDTLVGGKTKATPAMVVDDAGVPTIFVRGLDDRVHRARRVGGQWSTFGEWAPETILGAPGVYRNRQGIVRVYAAMADQRIFFRAV
ncbi:hypothetical protein BJF78_18490 [Pseudonocardia sp. CNS-139]|nr:hypothetical protein BJF78_18490 [Pseudonocardia sp. CNS-139]